MQKQNTNLYQSYAQFKHKTFSLASITSQFQNHLHIDVSGFQLSGKTSLSDLAFLHHHLYHQFYPMIDEYYYDYKEKLLVYLGELLRDNIHSCVDCDSTINVYNLITIKCMEALAMP
jgi:hypothetical protein